MRVKFSNLSDIQKRLIKRQSILNRMKLDGEQIAKCLIPAVITQREADTDFTEAQKNATYHSDWFGDIDASEEFYSPSNACPSEVYIVMQRYTPEEGNDYAEFEQGQCGVYASIENAIAKAKEVYEEMKRDCRLATGGLIAANWYNNRGECSCLTYRESVWVETVKLQK